MYFSHENYAEADFPPRRCLDTKLPSLLPSFLPLSTSSKAKNLSIYNFSTFPGIDVLISSSFANVDSLATRRSSFSSVLSNLSSHVQLLSHRRLPTLPPKSNSPSSEGRPVEFEQVSVAVRGIYRWRCTLCRPIQQGPPPPIYPLDFQPSFKTFALSPHPFHFSFPAE